MKKGTVYTAQGTFSDGKGKSLNLREAIDELGKCCGYSCCEQLIRLKDQSTGDTHTIQIVDGKLVIKNETNPGTDIVLPEDVDEGGGEQE